MSWNTYNCPICYYVKNPDLMKNSTCMKCDSNDSLWFCIICAHVACDNGAQGHVLEHYKDTQHKYVMELRSFSVWDYETKKILHKFMANDRMLDNFHSYIQENCRTCSCRFCKHLGTPKLLKEPACMKCAESQIENLWICLLCSHIGCGRQNGRHALEHYTTTKHPHSMQLCNFSIWDYKGNKYLHCHLHHDTSDQTIKTETQECAGEDGPAGHGEDGEDLKENFEKCMNRLEHEWQEFSKLTEANKKIITIEERLLSLTDEKRKLEAKLREHDAKLNELLTQFVGNRENLSVSNNRKSLGLEASL